MQQRTDHMSDEQRAEVPTNVLMVLWDEADAFMREFYRCVLEEEQPSPDFLAKVDEYILKLAEEG